MKNILCLVFFILCFKFPALASKFTEEKNILTVKSIEEHTEFIERIAKVAGYDIKISLIEDFQVKTGAEVRCDGGNHIYISPTTINKFVFDGFGFGEASIKKDSNIDVQSSNTNWALNGLLLHELGHIVLKKHCNEYAKNGNRLQAEIEADIFMGELMHKLDATLEEAQSCLFYYSDLVPINGIPYKYPPRKERLLNIKKGWEKYKPNENIEVEKDLVKARKLFINHNFKQARKLFFKHQEKLSSNDLQILGNIYLISLNFNEAFYWYRKSALKNNAIAQNNLGYLYNNGVGTPKDSKKAFHYYKLASEQGLASAKTNLGLSYFNGDGVKRDKEKGIKLIIQSAKQGSALGQRNYGVLLLKNEISSSYTDDKKRYQEALSWIEKSANQNDLESKGILYKLYKGVRINVNGRRKKMFKNKKKEKYWYKLYKRQFEYELSKIKELW